MDAAPDDRAGSLVAGRYDVGPLVGLGGTAQVYRAWDHDDGCAVALKVFRPGAAPAPEFGGARELRVLTGLQHPGLVGVRGAGVDAQGCPFVVMDLVDGDTLADRLHDGPLPPATVTRLGVVLADALAAVHARGVVHRDVKPANVLIDADDRPWLTDFGIARIVDATRVTATGVVVGTAAYMAPEQVRGATVGPAADVYALGLVLLEAATGRREYGGGAIESALARLHRAPLVPADVPEPLAATVRAMTLPDPDARPAAPAVVAALRGPAAPVRRSAVTRRVAIPVAALACLVAGALTGATALVDGQSPAASAGAAVPAAAPQVPGAPEGAVQPEDAVPPAAVPLVLAIPETTAQRPAPAPRAGARSRDDTKPAPRPAHAVADRDEGRDDAKPVEKDDDEGDDDGREKSEKKNKNDDNGKDDEKHGKDDDHGRSGRSGSDSGKR